MVPEVRTFCPAFVSQYPTEALWAPYHAFLIIPLVWLEHPQQLMCWQGLERLRGVRTPVSPVVEWEGPMRWLSHQGSTFSTRHPHATEDQKLSPILDDSRRQNLGVLGGQLAMQPPPTPEVGGEWGLREGAGQRFSFLHSACGALPGGLEGEAERGAT